MKNFLKGLGAALVSPTAIKLYEVAAVVIVQTTVKNPHSKQVADSILSGIQSAAGTAVDQPK